MTQAAPGKHFREGLSLVGLSRIFPDDAAAERWFHDVRWPDGPCCPHCGSFNVQADVKHRTMTHRCRDCRDRKFFSLKTGTVMEGSKLGYQVWAMAFYLLATNLKGVSSMKLHRDLDVTQKTAWHLAHRIRAAFHAPQIAPFEGPVEADETYVGGKRRNMSNAQRKVLDGRGPVGKTAVAGVKDRKTKQVRATVVERVDGDTLCGFVDAHTVPGAQVYTDESNAYARLPRHEVVKHSVGEYVRGQAHTNGLESFWSMLKRGYTGVYHKMSPEHLARYVAEFEGRHNQRPLDTLDQMSAMVLGCECKRLRYRDLIGHGSRTAAAR